MHFVLSRRLLENRRHERARPLTACCRVCYATTHYRLTAFLASTLSVSTKEVILAFAAIDVNRDGFVDLDEFSAFVAAHRTSPSRPSRKGGSVADSAQPTARSPSTSGAVPRRSPGSGGRRKQVRLGGLGARGAFSKAGSRIAKAMERYMHMRQRHGADTRAVLAEFDADGDGLLTRSDVALWTSRFHIDDREFDEVGSRLGSSRATEELLP